MSGSTSFCTSLCVGLDQVEIDLREEMMGMKGCNDSKRQEKTPRKREYW